MAAIYGPPTSPQPVQPAPGAASGLPSGNAPAQNSHSFGGYSIGMPTNQQAGLPMFGRSTSDIQGRMQTQAQPAGPLSGPGFGENYIQQNIGQYGQPSALETFANQQLQGDNPYYQRLQQQGDAAMNQQLASRGHYNSQGAMSSLGNFHGALGAAQFQDMGNLLGQAGNMQLNRENSGVAAAAQDQGLGQNRLDTQFNQLSTIGNLGSGNDRSFYTTGADLSGDAALKGIGYGSGAANATGSGQSAQTSLFYKMMQGAMGMPPTGGGGGGGQRYGDGLMAPAPGY